MAVRHRHVAVGQGQGTVARGIVAHAGPASALGLVRFAGGANRASGSKKPGGGATEYSSARLEAAIPASRRPAGQGRTRVGRMVWGEADGRGLGCGDAGAEQQTQGGGRAEQGGRMVMFGALECGVQRSDRMDCMRRISADWSATTEVAKSDSIGSSAASGLGHQVVDHVERALMVLDHALQKQPVEVRTARGCQGLHLGGRQHAGHDRRV